MSSATKIYVTLKLSRSLTTDEIVELNSFDEVELSEYCLFGEEVKSIGLYFNYYNFWKYQNETLLLEKSELFLEYYFFIESLLYLIKNFFNPFK